MMDELLNLDWMKQNVKVEVLLEEYISNDTLRRSVLMVSKHGGLEETGLCVSPYIETDVEGNEHLVERNYLNQTYIEMMKGQVTAEEVLEFAEENTLKETDLSYWRGGVCLVEPTAGIFCKGFADHMTRLIVNGKVWFTDYYVLLNNRRMTKMMYCKSVTKLEAFGLHRKDIMESESFGFREGNNVLNDTIYLLKDGKLYEL